MRKGFIAGHFLPPHAGHDVLIDTARAHVDALTVAVYDAAEPAIPAALRARWLREAHPDVDVVVLDGVSDDGDSAGFAASVRASLGYVPDVVFTAAAGGGAYARELGSERVELARARELVSIPAAALLAAPLAHLASFAPPVRAYFVRRVCVIGPESTGKTVLCQRLAAHFDAPFVAEYGRDYTLAKLRTAAPDVWEPDEFVHIAREQQRREDEAARGAKGLVVCDTDAFATEIWLERYLGAEARHALRGWPERDRPIDLYLLTDPNVPFVADEIRDGEHLRAWMFERFARELTRRARPFTILSGSFEDRTRSALAAVATLVSTTTERES